MCVCVHVHTYVQVQKYRLYAFTGCSPPYVLRQFLTKPKWAGVAGQQVSGILLALLPPSAGALSCRLE